MAIILASFFDPVKENEGCKFSRRNRGLERGALAERLEPVQRNDYTAFRRRSGEISNRVRSRPYRRLRFAHVLSKGFHRHPERFVHSDRQRRANGILRRYV